MSQALGELAQDVGVHERTLRRAASCGLIHASRPSARRLLLSEGEAAWVRSRWSLVGQLLAALRTEPNVELAVLFGSVARGTDEEGVSDLDLLVEPRRASPGAFEALRARLERRLCVAVELVPLQAALREPSLLAEVLRDGRSVVDRAGVWPRLQAKHDQTRAQADRASRESRQGARVALGYFQRLAAERAQQPSAGWQ
jgi:predicted nucleotidyltransferase